MSGLVAPSVNYPSVLMYHELPIHGVETHLLKKMTRENNGGGHSSEDIYRSLFGDDPLLLDNLHPFNWDCPDCPPPEFHLPPPPRPPWMEELDDCDAEGQTDVRLSDILQHSSTCDSNLVDNLVSVNDTQSYLEDTFHSIAVIVVCSVILVILLLIVGVVIFKKRKSLYTGHGLRQCSTSGGSGSVAAHASSTLGHGPQSTLHHHQLTLHKVGDQLRHHLATPHQMGSTIKSTCHIPADMLVNAAGDMQVIHARTVCGCGNPSNCSHPVAAASGSGSGSNLGTMPNHYIPEGMQPKMIIVNSDNSQRVSGTATLDPLSQRRNMNDFRQRIEPPVSRNVMTLSARPPVATPTNTTGFPPHILIGGQPFYLVPTSATDSGNPDQQANVQDNYTYPQNIMPIYEEIDGHNARIYNGAVSTSDFEYNYIGNAEQGPFMTSERRQHPLQMNPSDIMLANMQQPRQKSTATQGSNASSVATAADRPQSSSASHSQHTNSSEISSCNSGDDQPVNPVAQGAQNHHVLVNPFPGEHLNVTDEIKRFHQVNNDNSFSSDYVNSSTESSQMMQKLHHHNATPSSSGVSSSSPSYKYPPRVADGFERCRSPQSVYSAKLALKTRASPSSPSCSSSGNSSGGKSSSSVYYYSDTLRKPSVPSLESNNKQQQQLYQNDSEVKATGSSGAAAAASSAVSKGSPSKLLTTSDESDSGIAAGNKFALSPLSKKTAAVNTRVVLDEAAKNSELV